MIKTVVKNLQGSWQSEGVGAKVLRSIGNREFPSLDPFLLFDEFRGSKPAGFPDHPHRGFETVTYMLLGAFEHKDFIGNRGVIHEGDVQWMTAGRGVVHSEMPHSDGICSGLQLWINLSSKDKLTPPAYQDLSASTMPTAEQGGVSVKVIAGQAMNVASNLITRTPAMYLHFTVKPDSSFQQPIPADWNAFAYVISGSVYFGPTGEEKIGEPHHLLVFSEGGDNVNFVNKGSEVCSFILVAGKPIKEPVARGGPFVMNTQQELMQAFEDYDLRQNGFEGAI